MSKDHEVLPATEDALIRFRLYPSRYDRLAS